MLGASCLFTSRDILPHLLGWCLVLRFLETLQFRVNPRRR